MPVYVKQPGAEAPPSGTHYVVARNGLHMHVQNDWLDAVIPVKEFSALEREEVRATVLLPPIGARVFAEIFTFFEAVFKRHSTEAAVLLHYSKEYGWAFTVPIQHVSRAYVKYEMDERLAGYRCVGTMHSHGSISAGHSQTDIHDEAEFDGIHVTLGSFQRSPQFTMAAEIVCRGQRFKLPIIMLEGVIPPIPKEADEKFKGWMFPERYYSVSKDILGDWTPHEDWFTRLTVDVVRFVPIKPSPLPMRPSDQAGAALITDAYPTFDSRFQLTPQDRKSKPPPWETVTPKDGEIPIVKKSTKKKRGIVDRLLGKKEPLNED